MPGRNQKRSGWLREWGISRAPMLGAARLCPQHWGAHGSLAPRAEIGLAKQSAIIAQLPKKLKKTHAKLTRHAILTAVAGSTKSAHQSRWHASCGKRRGAQATVCELEIRWPAVAVRDGETPRQRACQATGFTTGGQLENQSRFAGGLAPAPVQRARPPFCRARRAALLPRVIGDDVLRRCRSRNGGQIKSEAGQWSQAGGCRAAGAAS